MGHFKIIKVKCKDEKTVGDLLKDLEVAMNKAVEIGYDSMGTPQIHKSDLVWDDDVIYAYSLMYRHKENDLTEKEEDNKIYKS